MTTVYHSLTPLEAQEGLKLPTVPEAHSYLSVLEQSHKGPGSLMRRGGTYVRERSKLLWTEMIFKLVCLFSFLFHLFLHGFVNEFGSLG